MEIQLRKVSAGRTQILKPLHLKVKPGKVIAILGRNGSGKSTLINAITEHPSYKLDGKVEMDEPVFVGFQKPVELPELNTGIFLLHLDNTFGLHSQTVDELIGNYQVMFDKLGITKAILSQPLNKNVSGGENKRLEIAQMIIIRPKTILLDEIDTGLDLDILVIIGELIAAYHKEYNPTMAIVTHNLMFLKYFPVHEVVILEQGEIVRRGTKSLITELAKSGFTKLLSHE